MKKVCACDGAMGTAVATLLAHNGMSGIVVAMMLQMHKRLRARA